MEDNLLNTDSDSSLHEYPTGAREHRRRWGVGTLAACMLHQSIYYGSALFSGWVERSFGYNQTFVASPVEYLKFALWATCAVCFFLTKRPSWLECVVPFMVFLAYWFLASLAFNLSHHDVPDDVEWAFFAPCMFVLCLAIMCAPPVFKGLRKLKVSDLT